MKIFMYPVMNEADGMGGDGGGGAPSGGDTDAGTGDAGQSGGGSVLSGATGGDGEGNAYDFIPEKYRVFGDNETFDLEASSKKMGEGYQSLTKRLGSDDIPPETPEGYELNAEPFGEGFNAKEFMADEKTQGFLKSMHAKGMTNGQIQAVLEYGLNEWAPSLAEGNQALSEQECADALKQVWETDAEFSTQVNHAVKALKSAAGEEFGTLMEKYGNDPDFIKVMASFGREMNEDSPPNESFHPEGGKAIEELMASEAYNNPNHPEYKKVSQQVKAYFDKKFGSEPAH